MKKYSLFIYNTIITASTSIILNFITIVFNIYISNILSNDILGIYQLILSIHYFVVTIATLGINLSITKTIAEELALNNIKITNSNINIARKNLNLINHPCIQYKLNKILKIGIKLSLLLSFIAMILLIYFTPIITKNYLHNKISCTPLYICSLSLPFISVSTTLIGYFSGIRKAFNISICRLIEEFTQFSIILILLKLINYEKNTIFLILTSALTISEIIACFSLLIFFYKDYKTKYSFSLSYLNNICKYKNNTNYFKKILTIAFPIGTTSILRSGLSTIKQILIPITFKKYGMNTNIALSNYGLITGIALPIILFPNIIIISISNLLIPEISHHYIKKDYKAINNIINKVFKISFMFSITLTFFFYFFSNKLSIILYPNKSTSEIAIYIKLLCPLILFMYSDNIIDSILKGLNKQVIVMITNILDLIISICLITILIPKIGLNGYIIVLFFSEVLNFTISFFELKHDTNFCINFKENIIKPFIINFLSLITLFIFTKYIFHTYYTYKLFTLLFETICYIFLLLLFRKIFKLKFILNIKKHIKIK